MQNILVGCARAKVHGGLSRFSISKNSVCSNRRSVQFLKHGVPWSPPAASTWRYEPLGSIAVDDPRTLLRPYAVAVVENQASGTLAAWYTGLKAVALYHPQWYIHVHAGYRAGGAALVKDKAPLHWTSHSCGRQRNNQRLTKSATTRSEKLQVSLNFKFNIFVSCT